MNILLGHLILRMHKFQISTTGSFGRSKPWFVPNANLPSRFASAALVASAHLGGKGKENLISLTAGTWTWCFPLRNLLSSKGAPIFVRFFLGGVEVTDFSRDFSASDLVGLRMGNVGYRCSEAIAKGESKGQEI